MTLSAIQSALVAVFLLLLMFGMGATLTRERFGEVMQAPAPLVIGLLSQFVWMPLAAFLIAIALELPSPTAIGLIIMGCSSGGTSSNFFTYFARADLALSISMTVCSTLVGFLAIPLVLAIYTRPFVTPDLSIPYAGIVTTLVAVILPVGLGVIVRSRSVTWAVRVERVGSFCGWGVLALVIAGSLIREGDVLLRIPAETYLAATLLGPLGFALGYSGARALRLAASQRRAVALETGIQNAPLALAVIALSFPPEVAPQVLIAPMLYGVIVVPCSALVAWAFRRGLG